MLNSNHGCATNLQTAMVSMTQSIKCCRCCKSWYRSLLKHWIYVVQFTSSTKSNENLLQRTNMNFFPSNQLPRNVTQECHLLQKVSQSKDDIHKLQTGMKLMTTIFCSYHRSIKHRSKGDTCAADHVFDRCWSIGFMLLFNIFNWINDNLLRWTSKNFFPFKSVAKKSDSRMPLTTTRVD